MVTWQILHPLSSFPALDMFFVVVGGGSLKMKSHIAQIDLILEMQLRETLNPSSSCISLPPNVRRQVCRP